MTRDDIIRMAREAGWSTFDLIDVERFFKLAYEAGAAAEREGCARVCAEYDDDGGAGEAWAGRFAAAIRARGQPDAKVTHLNAWARDRLARHGIQLPEDEEYGNPSF
jgi:hypothetical protein